MIATVLNERESIGALIDSLATQQVAPGEVVIADAGSTDGTRQALADLAARHPFLRVIDVPGDRSTGRNAAISAAHHDAIACIDGGCVAEPQWLGELVAPLEDGAQWVAGFYRPEGTSLRSTCIGLAMVWVRDEVDPATFLPSARSMSFRRAVWAAIGGFPEGTDFGEDTLFDERLLAAGYRPEFAGDAVVRWRPPPTFRSLAKTAFRWGRSDGELGLGRFYRRRRLAFYGATPVAAVVAAALWWPAVPLVVAPLAVSVARQTRHKYRWAQGAMKYLYIALAQLVSDYFGQAGYVVGKLRSR